MAQIFGYKREAIRVKVMKCEGVLTPEYKKFSIDPQITSYEVLLSLLVKAFDIKGDFSVCYKVFDDYGQETYLPLLSDWDLDAAFLSASEPHLNLRIEARPFEETCEIEENPVQLIEAKPSHGLPGFIMNRVEKTFNLVQRALNFTEEVQSAPVSNLPPRPPLMDAEFRQFLDPIGEVIDIAQLRSVIYYGGIDPSLRKVVWKHILNVYPKGMSGKQRMDYMKRKSNEYTVLRDRWREMVKNGKMVGDLAYVTGMVKKDVLRTDRHHVFYAGSDDNKNIASLFNILTTYALNHPSVSYCQGMSDLASPLLVTMNDEAHAYICFCALMKRLAPNFLLDGITMTKRFQHLADGLQHYDPVFYQYLKSYQADDLLFCYRWLLLEMKREFAFDDALRMLEVMWSSLPPANPEEELQLYEQEFMKSPPVPSPRPKENAYTKICALRRGVNHISLEETPRKPLVKTRPYTSLDDTSIRKLQEVSPKAPRIVRNLNEFFSLEKTKDKPKEKVSPDDSTEYYPMTISLTRELRLDLENLDRHVFGNDSKTEDVFVWENPLRNEMSPDEIEVSVTQSEAKPKSPTNCGNEAKSSLLERRRVTLEEIPTSNGKLETSQNEKAEPRQLCGPLPSPREFGDGNPFLMFLCITVLTQHREPIMHQGMDYNEMAMHFDRMVRKHDVTKVLNQARLMYESYLKLYDFSTKKSNDTLKV
ncbi:TBC1 domain family member 25 isoform X2 [Cimex lectularius]|uniref:Rab-GAP TBC domain-containing protein n=1 Tax=Cimex lectularius TaxID=79782 RepID=A0A8I6S696_CIMLE|nr:TBC1 domain family member 25 isoform X2 [Cimex lectularius]